MRRKINGIKWVTVTMQDGTEYEARMEPTKVGFDLKPNVVDTSNARDGFRSLLPMKGGRLLIDGDYRKVVRHAGPAERRKNGR